MADLIGTDGNDVAQGTNDDDRFSMGAGNDVLFGLDGNDRMDGGAGSDRMQGALGDDVCRGPTGRPCDRKGRPGH